MRQNTHRTVGPRRREADPETADHSGLGKCRVQGTRKHRLASAPTHALLSTAMAEYPLLWPLLGLAASRLLARSHMLRSWLTGAGDRRYLSQAEACDHSRTEWWSGGLHLLCVEGFRVALMSFGTHFQYLLVEYCKSRLSRVNSCLQLVGACSFGNYPTWLWETEAAGSRRPCWKGGRPTLEPARRVRIACTAWSFAKRVSLSGIAPSHANY